MSTRRKTGAKPQQCPATKRDGEPCTGKPLASGYCFAHDPASREWRAQGGRGRSTVERVDKHLPGRLAPIVSGLEEAFAGVRKGTADPASAHALARLASALIAAYDAQRHEPSPGELLMRQKDDDLMLSLASDR
jgi:Family of unknown function (DUF5763)